MSAVSNTSPLFNLAMIGRLALIREQFDHVWIPVAVREELEPVRQAPEIHSVDEAIVLAHDLDLKRVLMDEREGRRTAKQLLLEPIGVLGILLKAKQDGRLDSVREAMQELREKAGFFIDSKLYFRVLKAAHEG